MCESMLHFFSNLSTYHFFKDFDFEVESKYNIGTPWNAKNCVKIKTWWSIFALNFAKKNTRKSVKEKIMLKNLCWVGFFWLVR